MSGNEIMTRPRTSRWRPGRAFEEMWTNAKCAWIGFLLGRGYSSPAVAETLDDGTTDADVRNMARKWGLPTWGKKSDGFIVIPITQRSRSNLADRAAQHGISMEEYCKRLLICASMPRDRYDDIVPKDQFL